MQIHCIHQLPIFNNARLEKMAKSNTFQYSDTKFSFKTGLFLKSEMMLRCGRDVLVTEPLSH